MSKSAAPIADLGVAVDEVVTRLLELFEYLRMDYYEDSWSDEGSVTSRLYEIATRLWLARRGREDGDWGEWGENLEEPELFVQFEAEREAIGRQLAARLSRYYARIAEGEDA